jgi:predicted small secreted protein
MMKADANASAITTLQNTVTQQGKDITSSSSAITSLQNGLVAANSNIDKKADATALQSLQNTVTQQGKDISTQSGNVTNLQNSLSATPDLPIWLRTATRRKNHWKPSDQLIV